MPEYRFAVLGAGGHGAVVSDCIVTNPGWELVAFLDDDKSQLGNVVFGIAITGPINSLDALPKGSSVLALGIGSNKIRERILGIIGKRYLLPVIVHSRGWASPSAKLGEGTVVCAMAVV